MFTTGFGLLFVLFYFAALAGAVIAVVLVVRALQRIADAQEMSAEALDRLLQRLEAREQTDESSE
jgi:Flp pilus assembly protein TadG